jgi:MFS transporter, SET family, sugar efflux transporter
VHAGALAIGLFFAGRGAIGIVVSLAGGRLSDRMRDRRVPLALSGLAGALGAACFAVLHGYAAAFVAGAVLLNLGGVAFSQLFAYAREHAEARELGTTAFTSAIRSVFSASWVVGPPFGFYLLSRYGFRPLYLTAAGLSLITALLGRWGLPRLSAAAPLAATAGHLNTSLRSLGRRTYVLLAAIVILGVVNQIYSIDVALYVTKDLHLGTSLVGWLAGLSAGLEIPVMISSPSALLALQLVNAAWTAVALSIPMVMIQDEVRGGAGTSAALYSTTYTSAGLIAGAVTGVTAAAIGFRNVFWVCAGLSVLAVLLLAARSAKPPHLPAS